MISAQTFLKVKEKDNCGGNRKASGRTKELRKAKRG